MALPDGIAAMASSRFSFIYQGINQFLRWKSFANHICKKKKGGKEEHQIVILETLGAWNFAYW